MPAFDVLTLKELLSLGGSMIAVTSTFYFWLVRSNGERPNLEVFGLKPIEGQVIFPQEAPHGFFRMRKTDDDVCAMYWLDLAVVNNSTLPNAILGLQVMMRRADGSWQETFVRWPDDLSLPLNLSPLTTQGLNLALALSIDGPLGGDNQSRIKQAAEAIASPTQLRVQIQGLKNRTFDFYLTDSGDSQQSFAQIARAA